MPRGRRIAYKPHVITGNITKHDDSLSKEGGKSKTGLNCLYNFNKEKRHYKYKASYQIGTKSTTSEARKRKEQRSWKGKRGSSLLVKTEEKERALFSIPWEESPLQRTLSRTYLVFSNWKQLIVKLYICATSAGQTVSPGKPRRLFGTSAPEGEWTYNCLKGQYLSTNGLFGTSYVFSELSLAL